MVNIMDLATSRRCLFFSKILHFVEEYQHMNSNVQFSYSQDGFLGLC